MTDRFASPGEMFGNVVDRLCESWFNTGMTTSTAPAHFTKDLDRLATALTPWVNAGIEPGHHFLSTDAPEHLTRPYFKLVQMGYANGWL